MANAQPLVLAWRQESTGVFFFIWAIRTLSDGRSSLIRISSEHDDLMAACAKEGLFRDDFRQALIGTSTQASLCVFKQEPSELLLSQLSQGLETRSGPFAQVARALGPGDDRRLLQLAVQFLSNDGVADDVAAAPVDKALLTEMKAHLGIKDDDSDA